MSQQIRQVVFLVVDSLRADTAFGEPMPFFDNHAITFTEARAAGCWTLPSHAAMFTGAFPHETRCDRRSRKLGGGFPTLAELFVDAGWHTHMLTANGVTTNVPPYGLDRGFETVYKAYDHMPSMPVLDRLLTWASNPRLRHTISAGNVIMDESDIQASKPWFRNTSNDLLDQARHLLDMHRRCNSSSFIFLNLMDAHFPYHVTDQLTLLNMLFGKGTVSDFPDKLREIRALHDFVSESWMKVDHMTISPEMLEVLKERQWLAWRRLARKIDTFVAEVAKHQDALVVVCSDHGDAFGEDGSAYHVHNVTDGGNRVPLWIVDPEELARTIRQPVSTKDLFGTILRRAGLRDSGVDLIDSPRESDVILQAHFKKESAPSRQYGQFCFISKGTRYLWRKGLWHKAGITPLGGIEPAWEPMPGIELLANTNTNSARRRHKLAQHFREFHAFSQI